MALTIDERKDRYYKLVLEKGTAVYFSWVKQGIASKRLVAKAKEYAYNKRLKTDYGYRFQALVFAYALSLRVEKRYRTFLRKIFHWFAYRRERKALALLKRIWGLQDFSDIRDMIALESERIALEIAHRIDRESMRGGRRFGIDEIAMDEELRNFLEECLQEETQKTSDTELENADAEQIERYENPTALQGEEKEREKISVREFEAVERTGEEKKDFQPAKSERLEKAERVGKETEKPQSVQEEKTVEKSVAETSILAETIVAEQKHEETPSPFPVFLEPANKAPRSGKKEEIVAGKEQTESKSDGEKSTNAEKNTQMENERQKSPFPVFRNADKGLANSTVNSTANTAEQRLEIDVKPVESKAVPRVVSEENQARINANVTMSKEQIGAIVEQLKEQAQQIMAQEEQAWRENISVSDGMNKASTKVQPTSSSRNNNAVAPSHKK